MQYHVCSHCGSHLDFGEKCDCQEKREDASDAAETPSQDSTICTSRIVSGLQGNVNPCLRLREIRQQTGAMAKDAALVVREVFPKFNRQLLAQCEAWDKYGITIHPDGLKAICDAYGVTVSFPVTASSTPEQPPDAPIPQRQPAAGLTQCERILRHLNDYGSITSLEAMQEYGIMRLASRISDLKRLGHDIAVATESGKNRYGEKTSYARYSLKEAPNEPKHS